MKKRLLSLGLVLCLIFAFGWTGREFPDRSFETEGICYRSECPTGGTGMRGAPLSDKAVLLSADETFFGWRAEQELTAMSTYAYCFSQRVSFAENDQVVVPDIRGNDQLDLIVMAPRA